MKQLINEIYQSALCPELKAHIMDDMGFNDEDKAIIKSLMEHNASSQFHYDNVGMHKEKFERKLNNINRVLLPEIVRLANCYTKVLAERQQIGAILTEK